MSSGYLSRFVPVIRSHPNVCPESHFVQARSCVLGLKAETCITSGDPGVCVAESQTTAKKRHCHRLCPPPPLLTAVLAPRVPFLVSHMSDSANAPSSVVWAPLSGCRVCWFVCLVHCGSSILVPGWIGHMPCEGTDSDGNTMCGSQRVGLGMRSLQGSPVQEAGC